MSGVLRSLLLKRSKLRNPSLPFWGVNGSHLSCLSVLLITANASS